MTPTFEKLKKGYFRLALIKTATIAIATMLFATGGIVLGTKLAEANFPIVFSILIGVGAGVLAGGIAFMLLRKKAKALAKRLDDEYQLNERVQTMLEYQDGTTEMLQLQRQDAEARLTKHTGGKPKAGKLWINAVAVGLAFGLFLTGVILPTAGAVNEVEAEEKYTFSNWQYSSMQQLIAYVDESPMHANLKPTAKTELVRLLDEVCDYDEQTGEITSDLTRTETTLKVNDSIIYLDEQVEAYNTYKKLYNTLTTTNSTLVVNYADTLRLLETGEAFAELREKMVDEENDYHKVEVLVESFVNEINACFALAQVPATDELLTASSEFLSAVTTASKKVIVGDYEQKYKGQQVAIDSAFDLTKDALDTALVQQSENRGSFDYIIAELVKIFEIGNPPPTGGESLPSINLNDSGTDSNEPGGAAGEGGIIFGSDEKVYYPDEQKQVEYGDIFIEYDGKKDDILKEQNITDEKLKEIIDKYNDKLYGASETEQSGGSN